MLPDSIPLVSANLLKASASVPVQGRSASSSGTLIRAEVVSVKAADDQFMLTVKAEGRSIPLKSEYPLPPGTRLELAVSDQQPRPQVQVRSVTLPDANQTAAATAAQKPAPGTLPQTPLLQPAQPVVVQQFLASRLPLLPTQPQAQSATSNGLYSAQGTTVSQANTQSQANLLANLSQASALHRLLAVMGPQSSASPAVQTSPQNTSPQNTNTIMPASVRQMLSEWVSQLPESPQLAEPAVLQQQIKQNGLSYENQLFRLAEQLRSGYSLSSSGRATSVTEATAQGKSGERGNLSSAENPTNANRQPATSRSELADMFRNLWLKAGSMAKGSPGQAGGSQSSSPAANTATAQGTAAAGLSAAGRTALAGSSSLSSAATNTVAAAAISSPTPTTTGTNKVLQTQLQMQSLKLTPGDLQAALQRTRTNLETAGSVAGDSLVHKLLSSDHKAVLGKALMNWLNQLRPEGTQPLRELPVSHMNTASLQDTPETFRLLQTALAQTEHEQVSRLQAGNDNLLNIPIFFRQGDQLREIQLQIRREEENSADEQQKKSVRWHLRLHFELEKLGNLDVELNLAMPAVKATFWSENSDTLQLLNHQLLPLRKKLQSLGAEVSELQARYGQLPPLSRNQVQQYLVDTHG